MHPVHLSALDAAFLHIETPEMPMHVGALYLLTASAAKPAVASGEFYERFKAMIAARLHLAPVFTRKLALMPFEIANPLWIEDDAVDLDYHIRRIVLPAPGSMDQLEKYVGRLHSSLLDRSRPLWEFYVIEGLQSGSAEAATRYALYSKVHHAALDGQAAVKVANTLLDATEVPRAVTPPRRHVRSTTDFQLGFGELLFQGGTQAAAQLLRVATRAPHAVKSAAGLAAQALRAVGTQRTSLAHPSEQHPPAQRTASRIAGLPGLPQLPRWPQEWSLGPRTHFNVAITNQRSFAAVSLSLAEVKQVGRALDATVNDVVLALCSGALRRYLANHGDVPAKSLLAAVPISTRPAGDTSANNRVTMLPVSLASNESNPLLRLEAIRRSAAKVKSLVGGALKLARGDGATDSATDGANRAPLDVPSLGLPWLVGGAVSLFGKSRIADHVPPVANVIVSNVPGPQVQLFVAGARVEAMYPVSIPVHSVGINITVMSYHGRLDFGVTACRRAVPDVRQLADHLIAALTELKTAAVKSGAMVDEMPVAALPAPKAKPAKVAARSVVRRKPRVPAATRGAARSAGKPRARVVTQ